MGVKMGTVALIVSWQPPSSTSEVTLVDVLSDDREVGVLRAAFEKQHANPLEALKEYRASLQREEDEFGDYVEDILAQPFVSPDVRRHGLQWLKSKMRIDQFERQELQASRIIADYALKIFKERPDSQEMVLSGPHSKVLVRIFVVQEAWLSAWDRKVPAKAA